MTWQSYQINPRKHPFCRIIFKNGAIFNEQYDKGDAEGEAKGKAEGAKEAMLKTAKAMKVNIIRQDKR